MTEPVEFSKPIQSVQPIQPAAPVGSSAPSKAPDFRSMLMSNLNEVNRLQNEADQGVQKLLTGDSDDVAGVLMAVNKAGVAFDLLMEVRNKLIAAYEEIQQMRI